MLFNLIIKQFLYNALYSKVVCNQEMHNSSNLNAYNAAVALNIRSRYGSHAIPRPFPISVFTALTYKQTVQVISSISQ